MWATRSRFRGTHKAHLAHLNVFKFMKYFFSAKRRQKTIWLAPQPTHLICPAYNIATHATRVWVHGLRIPNWDHEGSKRSVTGHWRPPGSNSHALRECWWKVRYQEVTRSSRLPPTTAGCSIYAEFGGWHWQVGQC